MSCPASPWPALVVVMPLSAAFLCFVLGQRWRGAPLLISLLATALCCVGSLEILRELAASGPISYRLGGWRPPWGIEYRIDGLNAFMLLLISSVGLLATLYSARNVPLEVPGGVPHYYALHVLLIAGLLGMSITGDVFNLYVFLEISSLAAYALIASAGGRGLRASFNYIVMGTVAACFYLLGVGYLYAVTGSLNMADLAGLLPPLRHSPVVAIALAFLLTGLAIKVALVPLHAWLPDAYAYAPSSASVLIASLMGKVGLYAMMRLLFSVFPALLGSLPVLPLLCGLGGCAVIVGSVLALAQMDFKRMLACSSISQVGYIVLGVGLANDRALTGALLHVLNHAVMKGALFMAAGAIIQMTGQRDVRRFGRLHHRMPLTATVVLLGALSMIGIPPTCGFFSKWYLLLGSLEAGSWASAGVILLSSLLNAIYFFRVIERSLMAGGEPGGRSEAPLSMLLPMAVLGAAILLLGIFNQAIVAALLAPALRLAPWR